jgi:hypothetical protein
VTAGPIPASRAGKELRDRKSTAGEKTVAASDLAQAKKARTSKEASINLGEDQQSIRFR